MNKYHSLQVIFRFTLSTHRQQHQLQEDLGTIFNNFYVESSDITSF